MQNIEIVRHVLDSYISEDSRNGKLYEDIEFKDFYEFVVKTQKEDSKESFLF